MERKYYLATPGGKSHEAILTWQKMSTEAIKEGYALAHELGAQRIYRSGERIVAFDFKKEDPGRAWRNVRALGCGKYMPNKTTKAGKEIMKKVDAIRIPDHRLFSELMGGGWLIVRGNMWGSVSFETIGDNYVVSVPIGDDEDFIPKDVTPLKLSEYYAMKEQAEETK